MNLPADLWFVMLRVSEISYKPFHSQPPGLSWGSQHFQWQCLPSHRPAGRSERLDHCSVKEGAAGDGNHGVGSRGTRDNSSTAAERRLIPSSHKFQNVTPCCSRYKESTLFCGRLTLFAFRNGLWKWLAMILRPISASAPLAFTDKGLWHSQRVLQTQHSSFCLCCHQFSQLWGISFLQMESKQLDSVYLSSAAITQIQTGLSLEHSQGQHIGELHFTAFPWAKINHEIMQRIESTEKVFLKEKRAADSDEARRFSLN